MALTSRELHLIRRLWDAGHIPARPRLVELGAQQLANDFLRRAGEIAELGRAMGVATSPSLPGPGKDECYLEGLEILSPDAPAARPFWQWLGFDYAAIDFDGGAHSIPLDLNFDSVPARYRGRFDLITNFGTTEHVANQLNAFRVVHDLAKVGGLMLHRLPAQGHLTHGLINYNPKFFWMLARSNGYRWIHMDFEAYPPHQVPDEVAANVRPFVDDVDLRLAQYRAADCVFTAAVQKMVDMAFVPPLDLPAGFGAEDATLRRRYWSVFRPELLERKFAARLRSLAALRRFYGLVQALYRVFPPARKILSRLRKFLRR